MGTRETSKSEGFMEKVMVMYGQYPEFGEALDASKAEEGLQPAPPLQSISSK